MTDNGYRCTECEGRVPAFRNVDFSVKIEPWLDEDKMCTKCRDYYKDLVIIQKSEKVQKQLRLNREVSEE